MGLLWCWSFLFLELGDGHLGEFTWDLCTSMYVYYCGMHGGVFSRSPCEEGPAAQLQQEWSAESLQLLILSEPTEGRLA